MEQYDSLYLSSLSIYQQSIIMKTKIEVSIVVNHKSPVR
jgi:hypothetical protein